MSHILDRAIWHALTGKQRHMALRHGGAACFNLDFGPFAATETNAPGHLNALAALLPPGRAAPLFTVEDIDFPDSLVCSRRASLHQMVLAAPLDPVAAEMRDLDADDVPAMMALVALTHPGPFAARTLEMGRYRGIFREGALVAMAGERLKVDGYTEISAVCTHPDFRGQRLSQALMADVAAAIFARGETPFLHVFADNISALAVYQRLGFTTRQVVRLATVSRAG